jgi:hypothetical protein
VVNEAGEVALVFVIDDLPVVCFHQVGAGRGGVFLNSQFSYF